MSEPRFSTQLQDREIFKLLIKGFSPKIIHIKLELSSVWVVYNAIRRNRSMWKNQIEQNRTNENSGNLT